ncbi:MAG: riboflavin synthase [Ferruginibacter sp.]
MKIVFTEFRKMFTGIIENMGIITSVHPNGTNKTFKISSEISSLLHVDQSVSHDGVCLTVESVNDHKHTVTAIQETLIKTNLADWQEGKIVNLERCMQLNGRLDGHIVQGHVDTIANCTHTETKDGSWEFTFEIDPAYASLIIEKGSLSLNGISLTIFNVAETKFSVGIIPYTYKHTNLKQLQKGDIVNIEFDMIGKYVNRFMKLSK